MNAIFFGTKRAFHGALRVMRRPLLSFGLTSARFDMMYTLLRGGHDALSPVVATMQSRLPRILGVSPSVVSRMLRSLEQLGLVQRRRSYDRRRNEVRLTERGAACVRAAYQALRRAAQRVVYMAICYGAHRDKEARFWNMLALDDYLTSIRSLFYDTATLHYPWGHPDD